MTTVTFEIPESQLLEIVRRLSPATKQSILKAIIPDIDQLDALLDYGDQRMRQVCAQRGIDWDSLSEIERQKLIDEILHEA